MTKSRSERRAHALAGLDPSAPGLEIGPLYSPLATKSTHNVVYVDVHLAEQLRINYGSNPKLPVKRIVDVDYALIQGDKTRSIAEATREAAPFHWVVASHVIEHVPDVIGWLKDIAEVLVDDGKLSLIIPDRRYCFDARRPETTVGEMLLAHRNGDVRPSVRAVYDHHHSAMNVDADEVWHNGPPRVDANIHDLTYVMTMVAKSDHDYVDCHVWLFTPTAFVEQLRMLSELGQLDFVVESLTPTSVGDMEFFATLRRLPRSLSAEERRTRQADGFTVPKENSFLEDSELIDTGATWARVSIKEKRLIDLKRAAAMKVRRLLRPRQDD